MKGIQIIHLNNLLKIWNVVEVYIDTNTVV